MEQETTADLREESRVPGDETLEVVFHCRKPYCVDLLDLVPNPYEGRLLSPEMDDFLRRAPPDALQPCAERRTGEKTDSDGSLGNSGAPLGGLEISDSVAEGVP